MRAAQVRALGKAPEPVELDGDGAVEIAAVALNRLISQLPPAASTAASAKAVVLL